MRSPRLLVFGIDALIPEMVFAHLDRLPHVRQLVETGAWGAYDAYCYGYGSHDNWVSLYTGLPPSVHGTKDNVCVRTGGYTRPADYRHLHPFWQVLSEHGISCGLWRLLVTDPPDPINGYMIAAEPRTEREENRPDAVELVFHPECADLAGTIAGTLPIQPLPKTAEELGVSWDQLRADRRLADRVFGDVYYPEGAVYFDAECRWFARNILRMQERMPVDVLFYYTATLDLVQHFQIHEPGHGEIVRCLVSLDEMIGHLVEALRPETVIILSDHGIRSFADHFPDTPLAVQQEAFGLRDKAVWLSNGTIVVEARNGGALMGVHSLHGTIIAAGRGVVPGPIKGMRTVDFYPSLLDLLGVAVPDRRPGYVMPFVSPGGPNSARRFAPPQRRKRIAVVQTRDVPACNKTINEVFLDNRFAEITVFGAPRFANVFFANPRVDRFVAVTDGHFPALEAFDAVYVDEVPLGDGKWRVPASAQHVASGA